MAVPSQKTPFALISKLGKRYDDSQDIRLQKNLLLVGSCMFFVAGFLWGVLYLLFQEPIAASIPLAYSFISFLSFLFYCLSHRYHFFRSIQLILILILPFFLMLALGGFINSSAVIFWSFICPLGALLFAEYKRAPGWLVVYLGLLVLSALLQPLVRQENSLPQEFIIVFYVLNIGAVSTIAFVLLYYFVGQKERAYRLLEVEQNRSESLLLNVLPREIADRLKAGEKVIADHCPEVSILFADLVGFTSLTNHLSPAGMVELLNEIYSHFDRLIEKHGAEKIRTIGDNYMIASGVPRPRSDHAHSLARLALEMNDYISSLPPVGGWRISFRMGINSGPVIAGVIGYTKFAYDVWGDTVNTASRMESQGVPGKIQITRATYDLICNDFQCIPNGPVVIKGKGEMETWFLTGATT